MLETRLSLLERVRHRTDEAAWDEFVAIYQPLLLAYACRRGFSRQDALDIVQDVFVRLVPALVNFNLDHQRGRFRSWLWQVTHSAISDWHRRRGVRTRAEQGWLDQQETSAGPSFDPDWDDLYRRHIVEMVLTHVRGSSPPVAWACFAGRILADRLAAEIAAELGISANAVYVNASRVLARVRERCAEFAEPLSDAEKRCQEPFPAPSVDQK